MSATVSNIVVGIGDGLLTVGAYGAAEGDCTDVGATKGGISVEYSQTLYDVTADNWQGIVDKIKTGEKLVVKTSMSEATLANLALAFGYPTTAVSSSTLSFGGSSTVTKRAVYINVKGPTSGTRKITLYRGVITGAVAQAYKKDGETLIPIEIELLEDTTKTANQRYGTIVDTGTDTTAPTVAMSTPTDGGTVLLNAKGVVIFTFTETNQIDENTLSYGDTVQIINVTVEATPALVAGTIAYTRATKVITFTPTANWTASDKLVAMISTGVADENGNHVAATYFANFSVTAA